MGHVVVGVGGPARALAATDRVVAGQVGVGDEGVALEAAMVAAVAGEMDRAVVAVAGMTRGLLARASASSPS